MTLIKSCPLAYENWWRHWIYGAMRQDQYNVGLQNLDSLAIFVWHDLKYQQRTIDLSLLHWVDPEWTLHFFGRAQNTFVKVPFQKSQNIKFSWHKKAKSGTNEQFCLQTKTKQNKKWKNFKEFYKKFISDISTSLWPNQTK